MASMTYIEQRLAPDEHILHQARVSWVAYIIPLTLCVALLMPSGVSRLASTQLALTNRRLIGKAGTFKRKSITLEHADIEVLRVKQSLLGKLFDYGAVTVIGKDDSRMKFNGIAEPFDLQLQVDEAVETAVLGKPLAQFAGPGGW